MILKGILTLVTIFYLQNGVTSDSEEALFEITDINSIKKFIDENYDTSRSDFSVLENLTVDEKKKSAQEFHLKMKALVRKISEMTDEYERYYNSWWDEVPKELKPSRVGGRDNFDLFALKGRLEILYKTIEHDVEQLSSEYLTLSQSTGNTSEINYCMHSWALHHYSANKKSLDRKLDLYHGALLVSDSIRQLFYDLTFYLSRVKKAEDNKYDYCKRTFSYHQEFYQMYKEFIIKAFQEFTVRYLSSVGQAICVSQSYMPEVERMKGNLFNELKAIMKSTKEVLGNTTYYMYECDPSAFENNDPEEEIHLELEKMMQTVIIAEKDLSTTQSCSHNCNLSLIKDTLNKTECDEFLDCQYSASGYQITELKNSSRRYGYFTDDDGGNKKQYGNPNRNFHKREKLLNVSSSYNWGTMRFCDYCICTCANKPSRSPHVTTVVSFRDQVSDIENNKAVVDVRFVKKDGVIHIQILEGDVLPYGEIENDSWKELDKFYYDESSERFYNNDHLGGRIIYQRGMDYARPEIMNLNDVRAPEKHVVTGVRFRFAGDLLNHTTQKQSPIELQIRVTALDFPTGKLINLNQSSWISPKEKLLKNELILENPDNPKYVKSNTDPTITSNKFVKFRASDLKKDAGQSTVPFFEGRGLKLIDKFLLGGIGLIHRGHPGSGGHIAMKIFGFDMSPYFNIIHDTPKTLLD